MKPDRFAKPQISTSKGVMQWSCQAVEDRLVWARACLLKMIGARHSSGEASGMAGSDANERLLPRGTGSRQIVQSSFMICIIGAADPASDACFWVR
jgi:hypothetical protein